MSCSWGLWRGFVSLCRVLLRGMWLAWLWGMLRIFCVRGSICVLWWGRIWASRFRSIWLWIPYCFVLVLDVEEALGSGVVWIFSVIIDYSLSDSLRWIFSFISSSICGRHLRKSFSNVNGVHRPNSLAISSNAIRHIMVLPSTIAGKSILSIPGTFLCSSGKTIFFIFTTLWGSVAM